MKLQPLIVLCLSMSVGVASAQEAERKHPRVSQVESFLQSEANDYLKGRFPGEPLLVKVRIDPLHRSEKYDGRSEESLPYLDLSEEEIRDEWDDPSASNWALMNRVRRIQLNVSLPDSITDAEVGETRENLMSSLKLVDGRDEIHIARKEWVKSDHSLLVGAGILLTSVCLLIFGMYFVNRSSVRKIAETISDLKSSPSVEGGAASAGSPQSSPAEIPVVDRSGAQREMSVSDPLRIHEYVRGLAKQLESRSGFPSRYDVYELDELGRGSAEQLGAVVVEFSPEIQRKLFSMTGRGHWVTAFAQPGSPAGAAMEAVQKLVRMSRDPGGEAWDRLIVQVWRLSEQKREEFLRSMTKDEAIAVLKELPRGDTVRTARSLFPGAWAPVLEHSKKDKAIPESRSKELLSKAFEMLPLESFSRVESFLEEKTLLQFIRYASVAEERELYAVLPPQSLVKEKRQPFFPVFDGSDEERKELSLAFTPEQWATALVGVDFSERKRLEDFFSDRQKFIYTESRRRFESVRPAADRVADLREQIARTYAELKVLASRTKIAAEADVVSMKPRGGSETKKNDEKKAA